MNILLFAFDGSDTNSYLPKNIVENSVTYTGTHDNDTAVGYIKQLSQDEYAAFKKRLRASMKEQGVYEPLVTEQDVAWALCKSAAYSKSYMVILPIQDILGQDNSCRMNIPSTPTGNWQYRLEKMPSRRNMALLKKLIKDSGRD